MSKFLQPKVGVRIHSTRLLGSTLTRSAQTRVHDQVFVLRQHAADLFLSFLLINLFFNAYHIIDASGSTGRVRIAYPQFVVDIIDWHFSAMVYGNTLGDALCLRCRFETESTRELLIL